jgi:hypothetical protein
MLPLEPNTYLCPRWGDVARNPISKVGIQSKSHAETVNILASNPLNQNS